MIRPILINDTKKTLSTLVSELPEFYVAKKVMEIDISPALISKELLCNDFYALNVDCLCSACPFKNNLA